MTFQGVLSTMKTIVTDAYQFSVPQSDFEKQFVAIDYYKRDTACISVKPWLLRLTLKVIGVWSTIIMKKKINLIKKSLYNENQKFKIRKFFKTHHPASHLNNKVTDLTTSNNSNMAKKLSFTNLIRFLRRIKSPHTR